MSFCSDIKEQLSAVEMKKDCCRENFELGKKLLPPACRCEKDAGCYLRGAFLRCGSISVPGRNFMLSFSVDDENIADIITDLFEKADLSPRRSIRRGKTVVYFKAHESIEEAVAYLGSPKIALIIMNEKIFSDARNSVNRICNAETANLNRAALAAAEQNEAINFLYKTGAVDNLPDELREAAYLRRSNPDMSLEQLRALMNSPISKSGLNHRLAKLISIADSLKNGK